MKKMSFRSIFHRGLGYSAPLRVIVPVALTFVLFLLSVFLIFIPSMEERMMAQKREMVRELTDSAWSILDLHATRAGNGKLTLEDAQTRAIDIIRKLRYGPKGKDYFWINDMHPRMIMHPYRPDLDGRDLSDYADPNGKHLFEEFVRTVRDKGAGYVDYMWQWKDDPSTIVPKISYVKGFEPWGWIIGTGIYVQDVRAEIKAITRRMILIFFGILGIVFLLSLYIVWQNVKTERRRKDAEERLIRSEKMFRTLGEDAPFGISLVNSDLQFEYLNPKFTEIFGYTLEDIPDKGTWFEKAYPDPSYREEIIEVWRGDLMENSGGKEFKPRIFTVRCKDGQDKVIQSRAVALEDRRQLITYEDITEKARMEETLRANEQKYLKLYKKSARAEAIYRSLLNSSADAIIMYDLEGKTQFINPSFTRIFGWTSEEVAGRRIPFLPDSERAETIKIIDGILEYGTPCHAFRTKRYTKDGRLLDVSISASRYDDHDGVPAGLLVILRDISERKRLEAQLQHAQRMESIGTLAGGVAHDFNNLLMAIQGNASLMLLNKDTDHPDYKKIRNIEKQVKKGATLTKELLGFARAGKYEVRPTEINETIRGNLEMFGRTKKEITISSRYQEDLWTVEADQRQLGQVFLNLFVNAWQAMPKGGELTVETENVVLDLEDVKSLEIGAGKYVKISVSDTGVGMDASTMDRIFDPFFTTREVGQGTGLGLASAYGIIRNHGGMINAMSEMGKGTTFHIYLPAVETEEKNQRSGDRVPEGKQGTTILLVDDEEMILEVSPEMLRQLGYQVLTAKSGEEALALYQANRERIDLVILDMIMPGMGGGETYDRLKKMDPHILVLLSSGYSIDGQATEILKRGCNGFIQKPFNVKIVSEKIREILNGRETTGETR